MRTSPISKQKVNSFSIKSMLILAACFTIFKPAVQAQRVGLDQQVLIELMEHRSNGATKYNNFISDNTQKIAIMVPVTVLAAGLITNDKMTLKKGLYIAETVAGSTFITYALKYGCKRDRP